ncbi:hypothetical protein [Nocardiopsis changdeensis]|uniref:hypothetical protein n=1 Tax=Nocardiopsis changdeensis TaxID=2831969 RepID=UPI003F48BA4A
MGAAWPVIAFVAVAIAAIARFVWRHAGEKLQHRSQVKRAIEDRANSIFSALNKLESLRMDIRETQLAFANNYASGSEEIRDDLVKNWHKLTSSQNEIVRHLAWLIEDLPKGSTERQALEIEKFWKSEMEALEILVKNASIQGSYGPFSKATGPAWGDSIARLESFSARFGIQLNSATKGVIEDEQKRLEE